MKLISKIENNIIADTLIKKGINTISQEVYEKLSENKFFQSLIKNDYIKVIDKKIKSVKVEVSVKAPDFTKMSYQELKKYVVKNNIKTDSMKKDDILKALCK